MCQLLKDSLQTDNYCWSIQCEAPKFDPDIDGDSPLSIDEKPSEVTIQGTLPTIPEVTEPEDDNSLTPGTTTQQPISQETDWPDAIPVQIPRTSSSTAQPEEQGHNRHQVQYYAENFEIPELEENLLILILFWHIIIHTKPVNTYDKNTILIYKIWMTTNIMPRLTGWTFLRVHWLHRTIGQRTTKQPCEDLWKSLKEYLAEAEVKPGEKSYTVIDHLAQELVPCKVTSSARLRRISIYLKGTLLTVNFLFKAIST